MATLTVTGRWRTRTAGRRMLAAGAAWGTRAITMRGTWAIAGAARRTGSIALRRTRAIAITMWGTRAIAGAARWARSIAITRWARRIAVARRAIATTKLSEPGGEFGFAHGAVVVGVESSEQALGRVRRWSFVFAGS